MTTENTIPGNARVDAIKLIARVIGCPKTGAQELLDAILDVMEEFHKADGKIRYCERCGWGSTR